MADYGHASNLAPSSEQHHGHSHASADQGHSHAHGSHDGPHAHSGPTNVVQTPHTPVRSTQFTHAPPPAWTTPSGTATGSGFPPPSTPTSVSGAPLTPSQMFTPGTLSLLAPHLQATPQGTGSANLNQYPAPAASHGHASHQPHAWLDVTGKIPGTGVPSVFPSPSTATTPLGATASATPLTAPNAAPAFPSYAAFSSAYSPAVAGHSVAPGAMNGPISAPFGSPAMSMPPPSAYYAPGTQPVFGTPSHGQSVPQPPQAPQ